MTRMRDLTHDQRAVYRALLDGPKSTNDLEADPGGRYSARLGELKDLGVGWDKRYDRRLGQWIYFLTEGVGVASTTPPNASMGGSTATETPASGSCVAGDAQTWFNVCDSCGQRWASAPHPQGCPSCLAGVHWLSSFTAKWAADDHVPLCHREAAA